MIEAITTSVTADLLVAAIATVVSATLGVVVQTLREVRRMDRILLGEEAVDADKGLVGKVRELDERIERIEQSGRRSSDE
jgi:hypothetical protein